MFAIFLECAFTILLMTAAVYGIGRALQKVIARGSEARRIHGRYVLRWAVACFLLGGCIGLTMLRPDNRVYFHEFGGGLAGFGLLLGLAVGSVHGGLVLLFRKRPHGDVTVPDDVS